MSETFQDIMAEISQTRPRVTEILDFSEERLKKVGIMVRPTLLNVLKFVRENLDRIPNEVLEKLVGSYDTIYRTDSAYDLQTKLQLYVEGKDIDSDSVVVDEVVDEVLADEEMTPAMDGPVIETTAEVVHVNPDGSTVAAEEAPEGVSDEEDEFVSHVTETVTETGEPAVSDAGVTAEQPPATKEPEAPKTTEPEKPKTTRKPREKSRIEELVSELMAKYTDLEKDNKRIGKENEALKSENEKLKNQLAEQSEAKVSDSLLDRLEKMVKGV